MSDDQFVPEVPKYNPLTTRLPAVLEDSVEEVPVILQDMINEKDFNPFNECVRVSDLYETKDKEWSVLVSEAKWYKNLTNKLDQLKKTVDEITVFPATL